MASWIELAGLNVAALCHSFIGLTKGSTVRFSTTDHERLRVASAGCIFKNDSPLTLTLILCEISIALWVVSVPAAHATILAGGQLL